MKAWKVVLGVLAIACVALVVVFIHGFGKDPHYVPFLLKGKPAPAFSLKRLDTGEVVSSAQLKGKPIVMNFWASWCGPCAEEMPVLEWAARRWGNDAWFVGVIFEDTDENARKSLLSWGGSSYPQLVDPLSAVSVDYGAAGVPETYFIDANGIIQDKFAGPLDPRTMTNMMSLVLPAHAELQR